MKIKSILVSQPQPLNDSSPYLELAKRLKIKIDFRPFIQVKGVDSKDVRGQKIDFSKFTAVLLTSKNAIDNYFRLAEEMRFSVPDTMKYFCQTESIALYLQKYIVYRKRKIYIAEKNFVDLSPFLKKNKDEKYLLPSSDILNNDVPETLNAAGVEWTRAILYNTVSSDLSDLEGFKYDALVFFSPNGIKSLFDNFPSFKQKKVVIATFGRTTIEAAKNAGLNINIQAPTPETPSMSAAIEKYIEANK